MAESYLESQQTYMYKQVVWQQKAL